MSPAPFHELKDKIAVVTGGAMGIGLDTSRRLLNEGCRVAIWDINPEALAQAADVLSADKDRLLTCHCDISDPKAVADAARKTEADLGTVDILINNAGMVRKGFFTEIPPEQHVLMTNVNLMAIYHTCHYFLPKMLGRDSGHVINISSAGALSGCPTIAVYSATKWAVWGLTESLRMEAGILGKKGVLFTSVHPMMIATGMFEGGQLNNWLGRLFIPGIETHDEVAVAIVEKALKKGRQQIFMPRTIRLMIMARSILPCGVFAWLMSYLGLNGMMDNWTGRPGTEHAARNQE